MMKIKFLKDSTYQNAPYKAELLDASNPENSVTADIITVSEIDEEMAKLIADGNACEFTPEVEDKEDEAIKEGEAEIRAKAIDAIKMETKTAAKTQTTKAAKDGVNNMKDLIFKGFQKALATKAVADVEGVSATEYMGYVPDGVASQIWAQISKWTLKDSTLRIVYRNGAKAFAVTGEATANALSAIPAAKTATAVKYLGSFTTASEYLEDVDGMQNYLNSGLADDLLSKVVAGMTDGAANGTSFAGLEGIAASADCLEAEFVSMTAPTIPELLAWKNLIDPNLKKNAMYIFPIDFGAGVEAAALTAGNIGGQYINLEKGTLFGRPYFVIEGVTTPIVGDFRQYVVNVARDLKVNTTENAATDTIETGVSIRVSGGIGWKASTKTAAFAKAVKAS